MKTSLYPGCAISSKLAEIMREVQITEAVIDSARDRMEASIEAKREMDLLRSEMEAMGIDTGKLGDTISKLQENILIDTENYMKTFMENHVILSEQRKRLREVESEESFMFVPVLKGEMVSKPLLVDSMRMDSRYFSITGNNSETVVAELRKFVSSGTSQETASEAGSLFASQCSDSLFCGSLVVSVSCRHRNVRLYESLDVDLCKAVDVWNRMHPDKEPLTLDSPFPGIAEKAEPLSVVQGAAYRSYFVGMIHFFRTDTAKVKEIEGSISELQQKMQLGSWFNYMKGEYGVAPEILNDVLSLIAGKKINTHISILSTGVIPTVKTNALKSCVKESVINGKSDAPDEENSVSQTMASAGENNKKATRRISVAKQRLSAMMEAISNADEKENNSLNVSTLLSALDNYLEKVSSNDPMVFGEPYRFYVGEIGWDVIMKKEV